MKKKLNKLNLCSLLSLLNLVKKMLCKRYSIIKSCGIVGDRVLREGLECSIVTEYEKGRNIRNKDNPKQERNDIVACARVVTVDGVWIG
jgi:hypothetical protein